MPVPPVLSPHSVGETMHRGVVTCRADTSALAVARTMAAHRIHCVPVVTDSGRCIGVVSDRELERALASAAPGSIRARDIAVEPVIVDPSNTITNAAGLMHRRETTHLVVSDPRSERVVGVLSVLDVADAISNGEAR